MIKTNKQKIARLPPLPVVDFECYDIIETTGDRYLVQEPFAPVSTV
jgi:hypothetical protein